ncbi:MAG: alpha-amylase family glycosyl hydrolase, partial [Ignavibacteria bacterium]|nr:alpha-amylase family glycosyl hydrolase [Ignavibacteria bacterium]
IIPPNPDWYDVADFNYDNKHLRKYMIDMMKYWVKKFDIDGFRCDVAENVPLDFWEELRAELDKIKPIFMLSEGTLPEHHLKAFDMTYSWNIYDILEDLVNGKTDPSIVIDILNKEKFTFPKNSLRMRFNENHDKLRATKVFGVDGAFITSALINTIPGVPLFYNGQEIGDSIYPSLFEKYSIPWKSRNDTNPFYDYYKKINKLRKKNLSLAFGDFKPVVNEDGILAFTRNYGGQNILSVFNFSKEAKAIQLNKLIESEGSADFNFSTSIGRKYRLNTERMGRPADTTIELEHLGFLIIEYAILKSN